MHVRFGLPALPSFIPEGPINIIERAHPDLGRLGVFWHTQGSGKSYSMAFFAEKVRRKVEGNFTFLLMTDRQDLDSQIYKTFVGTGVADDATPRAASGADLEKLLEKNHRYIFSLIHKFNQDVNPNRTTIEETFRRLVELVRSLDEDQERAARENLSDEELAVFDLLTRDDLTKADRERVKQASRDMLNSIKARLAELDRFWEKEQTKGEVEAFILDEIFIKLPSPPFTPEERKLVADNVYAHVWQQAMSGGFARAA